MSPRTTISVGNRYRLEHIIGRGGMGAVYQAHDRLTGQQVALKLVPVEGEAELTGPLSTDAETLALRLGSSMAPPDSPTDGPSNVAPRYLTTTRTTPAEPPSRLGEQDASDFSRIYIAGSLAHSVTNPMWARLALAQEFRMLAALRHPHIISVLDYGFITRGQPFFTMELLRDACSLRSVGAELPLLDKVQLLVQLLSALSYLHRHGILHRDLKPANVLVLQGPDGLQVKLLDFGLAMVRSQARQGELTGTLSYMAPELFEGKLASEAADLFAVGVMAYELFTNQHPFDRGDDGALVGSILGSEPAWEPLQPHAALIALLRRLLAKSPVERPSADETLTALVAAVGLPLPPETAALRESTLQAARLVGREEPLRALRAALDAARSGIGEAQLLGGESGVGKSRLMEELRVYSLVQGVLSVRGQAVSEGGEPYGVWREILRPLCLCTELDALEASVLKSIVPDLEALLERAIAEAPELNPQAAQLRLMHTIECLLVRQTEPLLLLFEDLHWADAASLLLLQRCAMSCHTRPILFLGSYRDDERGDLPAALPGFAVLKLPRLSTSSIAELCQSMLGDAGSTPELVSFLASETAGNVFFVIEVMRALAEEAGQLRLVGLRRLPATVLTGGIQAIVRRRLLRLPVAVLPLLRLAAVAGRQLDLALLRSQEPQLEPWLYLAADAAVLEVVDQGWRFAHDRIRDSLLFELDPAERQRLHLQLARALECTYPDSAPHTAALAEHYQRGGDATRAAFYLVAAGLHALGQGATEQATVLLTQALLPEARALLPRTQAARAYKGLVQAMLAQGRFVPCIVIYEQLMAAVGQPVQTSFRAMAAAGKALLARQLQKAPPRKFHTEEEQQIWSEVAHASRWACEAYLFVGQSRQSIVVILHGAELADALSDRGLQSYFLATFSYVAGLVPLRAASQWFLEKGLQVLAEQDSPRAQLDFSRVASPRHMNAADWTRARLQLDAALVLSRQVGDEYSLMYCLMLRLILAFREQDDAAFVAVGNELYQRTRQAQGDRFRRVYPVYLGLRALRRGDFKLARRLFAEAEEISAKFQDVLVKILVGGVTALCLLRLGEAATAQRRADETLGLVESIRLSSEVVGEGISALVEVYFILWEAGDAARQQQLDRPLRRALAALRGCARIFPSSAPRALLWYGRHAWNQGAGRLAQRLSQASQRRAEQLGMPFDVALARTWHGRFATTPGTPGSPGTPAASAAQSLAGELRAVVKFFTRGLR